MNYMIEKKIAVNGSPTARLSSSFVNDPYPSVTIILNAEVQIDFVVLFPSIYAPN